MADFVWLIPVGFLVGAYGTLIGVGGGVVLVPVLLLAYADESPDAIATVSLAVIFFNTVSGSAAYARMKRIDYTSGALFAAATCPGAILGALTTTYVPRRLFDLIFGVLMIGASAFILLRPKGERLSAEAETIAPAGGISEKHIAHHGVMRRLVEANGTTHTFSYDVRLGVGISLVVGYVSSLLGIGGGVIHIPAMTYLLNFPVHIATATSHFVLAIMTGVATVVHVAKGTSSETMWWRIGFLASGVLVGAQLGARLSNRLHGVWILRGLALALAFLGIRIFIMAF